MNQPFHSKIEEVESGIVQLGDEIVANLPKASLALLTSDTVTADEIFKADENFNKSAENLEQLCYMHLALQKPNGPELRRTISSLRIIADLERSHDLVVNIAKATKRMVGFKVDTSVSNLVGEMSRQAAFELKHAIEAYQKKDETLALSIVTTDSVLDATHRDLLQAIFAAHKAGNCEIEVALQYALVGRFLERIGDHAVNLSRSIVYSITGELGPDIETLGRQELS
jgi:phosphate transport system protein